jgi:hypothetical protein
MLSIRCKNFQSLFLAILSILVSSLLHFGESLPIDSLQPYAKAKWTVAVYMNGDNELEPTITGGDVKSQGPVSMGYPPKSALWQNPRRTVNGTYTAKGDFHFELAVEGSNQDVHVVALVDRVPGYADNMDDWTNTRLYYIQKDDYPDNTRSTYWTNSTADEMNMADTTTLEWFMNTVMTNFPSDYLYLSMWDHNWGWHNGYLQKDETSNDATMSYTTLSQLINQQVQAKYRTIDVIGYDACVSSQVEVLHTWRPIAKNFAGSQDYVGWGGVDYHTVIHAIQQNPSILPSELAVVIAKSMMTDPMDHCATAIQLDNQSFDSLITSIDQLALALLSLPASYHEQLIAIRDQSARVPDDYSDDDHRDLFTVVSAIQTVLCHPKHFTDLHHARADEAEKVCHVAGNIAEQMAGALLYNEVRSEAKACKNGHGMSIYWPKKRLEKDYFQTSFALSTHWDEFLSSYLHPKTNEE